MSGLRIRVLGPIEAEIDEIPVRLARPRHREFLGILVAAHGGVVSTEQLIDELWDVPAAGAVGAVRTFVGELRRILEPGRPARTPARALVTVGNGYALRLSPDSVDMWSAERAIRASIGAGADQAEPLLAAALAQWRGSPFAEFADREWAQPESARLAGLHADAVERLADARLTLGRPGEVIPLLEQHVIAHPWREGGWRLLALALYRSERQADALTVLRRARTYLTNALGLDPGRRLADLERGILRRDPALDLPDRNASILLRTASAQARTGARAQLEGVSALLPGLAVSGGLEFARSQRLAAIGAAEELGNPELTARVIGAFDVPGIWTRSDDPAQSAAVVGVALRTLSLLSPQTSGRSRAGLLATVAMESRGTASRGAEAREAEQIARTIGDAQLQCFAISARYMQAFATTGLADAREHIAAELLAIAIPGELPTFEIQARLIRMQALCALDDIAAAGDEADVIDALAAQHERPLATVFTDWFRWTFTGEAHPPRVAPEMPGFDNGIRALSALTAALRSGTPLPDGDFGPYETWTRPLLLARAGRHLDAVAAMDSLPDPPQDLLLEVMWCLVGRAALDLRHPVAVKRAHDALLPAIAERAAGSAVVDLGPIGELVGELATSVSTPTPSPSSVRRPG